MNSRYWTVDVKPPPNFRPYGSSTVAVMDEVEGSVILYCNELSAERIVSGLILLEETNRGN